MHALTIILLFVSTAQAASDDLFNAFELVNLARQAKGIRPLSWDANLTAYAQFWANQMASGSQPFEHARGIYRPDQGENLYEQSAGQCDASYDRPLQTAVHVWLSQERLYAGQPVMTGHEPWLHWCEFFFPFFFSFFLSFFFEIVCWLSPADMAGNNSTVHVGCHDRHWVCARIQHLGAVQVLRRLPLLARGKHVSGPLFPRVANHR